MHPTISIITINLNNAFGLGKTINSVLNQNSNKFEYIIIDGGSTDNSRDIISINENKIAYWVSETDSGIYNAMNKGILKANGKYLLFLNSGDYLTDSNVIVDFCNEKFTEDIVSGNLLMNKNGKSIVHKPPKSEDLSFKTFYSGSLPHPSTFIKRELFEDCGLYDEKNKIISDWAFFITALIIKNKTYKYFKRDISHFDLTGISSNSESMRQLEKKRFFQTNLSRFYRPFNDLYVEIDILIAHELKIVKIASWL
jgi:glycosyltransferase involved in cell wall biosynthesis